MSNCDGDVIDLTNSFTLIDHCSLANEIIEIDTDDSIILSASTAKKDLRKSKRSAKKKNAGSASGDNSFEKSKSSNLCKFGNCPICWDKIGENPLASTKCGHVYCLKCLEQSLSIEKKCPTCRTLLRGSSAYHPLYIGFSEQDFHRLKE